jgi:hypothetical protein
MSVVRRPKHVLAFVAALLIASGGVRLAMGVGPAIAFAEEQMVETEGAQTAPASAMPQIEPLLAAL